MKELKKIIEENYRERFVEETYNFYVEYCKIKNKPEGFWVNDFKRDVLEKDKIHCEWKLLTGLEGLREKHENIRKKKEQEEKTAANKQMQIKKFNFMASKNGFKEQDIIKTLKYIQNLEVVERNTASNLFYAYAEKYNIPILPIFKK